MLMKIRLLSFVVAVLLSLFAACNTTKTDEDNRAESTSVDAEFAGETEGEVPFFDLGNFDSKLSKALRESEDEVTVVFPAPITTNDIPERLDRWFAQLEKRGGTLEVAPDPDFGSRGIIGEVFEVVIRFKDYLENERTFGPLKDYNASVYYYPGTGEITRVVFKRREAESEDGQGPDDMADDMEE